MSSASLAANLIALPGFKRQLNALTLSTVASQFPHLTNRPTQPPHNWKYLLLCASILACSEREDAQAAALRIAYSCLTHEDTTNAHREAAGAILDALANQPALSLAFDRGLLDRNFVRRLPLGLQQDAAKREIQQTIFPRHAGPIRLNRFQRSFWDAVETSDWVSASAPTSAGKSFVVRKWIANVLAEGGPRDVVVLVPTRALVHEFETEFRTELKADTNRPVAHLYSMPVNVAPSTTEPRLFVFTQERLHLLLRRLPTFSPNLVFVDEAHKLGDDARGVLLSQVLDEVLRRRPDTRLVFASPSTANPDVLLAHAAETVTRTAVPSETITVNQNLLWATQIPRRPNEWSIQLCLDGTPVDIGRLHLPHKPASTSKRLPFVAHELCGRLGTTVVYVNGAAEAEKTAAQLFDLIGPEGDISTKPEVIDLVELVSNAIHPRYSLTRTLTRGVAFHYGDMPLLVRTAIERLFRQNVLKYLVCTSTLLEGVNLPCRNLVVRGPTRGKGRPMTAADFWNLAGRAGRWGKEFEGNIVCVDPLDKALWPDGPPKERSKHVIAVATEFVIRHTDDFLSFVEAGAPRDAASQQPILDAAFSYLAATVLRGDSVAAVPWLANASQEILDRLTAAIQHSLEEVDIPYEVLWRNPGISPIAMQSLLKYFRTYEKPVDQLLPSDPVSADAATVFARVFGRISNYLNPLFGTGPRGFGTALLIVNWMRGYPLARLIREWLNYLQNSKRQYTLAVEIRHVMSSVENIARFAAPKYLSCYLDLLEIALKERGQAELLEELPDFDILLEFGVSQRTQLSLMQLGLSRLTSISASELIANAELTVDDCRKWVLTEDIDRLPLPALVRAELLELKARTSMSSPDPKETNEH